jgi:ribosome maturation factor RimP
LLDDCAKASRTLAHQLDTLDLISGKYTLEVTSPGLDRPLFTAADYLRFRGRNAHLKFVRPQPVGALSLGAVDGLIVAATEEGVTLAIDGAEHTFAAAAIRGAELAPTPAEMAALMKAANAKPKSTND